MNNKILTSLVVLMFLSIGSYAQAKSDMLFIQNIGQIHDQQGKPRPDIDYVLHSNGLNIFIGRNKISYQFADSSRLQRVDACLVGANTMAKIATEQPQAYYENYYHNSKLLGQAKSCKKIVYRNIYPHIDWVLKINADNTFEYEYAVGALGNTAQIQMEYHGTKQIKLQPNGDLVISTALGKITEKAPKTYGKNGELIASQYVLKGNKLSYQTDPYVGALVIDPKVAWATYYGDTTMWISTYSICEKIIHDSLGHLYFCGLANDVANIATSGSYQDTLPGTVLSKISGFYAKMDTNGYRIYATYFGADSITSVNSLSVNKDKLYISGASYSNKLATPGTQQTFFKPMFKTAPFLAQFDSSGLLNWCTYVGGNNIYLLSVQCFVDIKGDVYAFGSTDTINTYIATPGAYKTIQSDSLEAFIVKYNPAGKRIWGTFYGGKGNETVFDAVYVPTDGSGALYIIGNTTSDTGIATVGAYQTTRRGTNDAMLIKFDTAGQRIWGTYIGGEEVEAARGIAIDKDNNVYVAGNTNSLTEIATATAYQSTFGGGNTDMFLMKFNSSGKRQWGTYFGGEKQDGGNSVCTDQWGNIFICGYTNSSVQIADTNAFQKNNNGLDDAFIAAFKPNGKKFWSSYYGGEGNDIFGSMTSDGHNLYLSGKSDSRSIKVATKGSFLDTNANGKEKGWIVKISEVQIGYTADTLDPVHIADISASKSQFIIYPNPNRGSFTFETITTGLQEAKISIVDVLGKAHWSGTTVADNLGKVKQEIQLGKTAATGIYFLHFSTNNNTQVIEFLI
ncbi:MAG: SBBP repeat-containing protein, partial [Chitinophagaceae bacterium]|nr:SBBP repeat-containing protein [Chitinophagaceae bacterium]